MTGATTAITIGVTIASTALAAVSSIQQGKAQAQQAKYNAAVAKNNQIIANQNAEDALKRGAADEAEQRKKTQLLLGQQRAGFAAQGADLGSGSVLDILGDTAAMGELDALTIRGNAEREARQFRVQGANYAADAQLKRMEARQATTKGYFDMGSSILGGASKLVGQIPVK